MVAVLSVRIMYCLQLVGKLSVPTIRRPGGDSSILSKLVKRCDRQKNDYRLNRKVS